MEQPPHRACESLALFIRPPPSRPHPHTPPPPHRRRLFAHSSDYRARLLANYADSNDINALARRRIYASPLHRRQGCPLLFLFCINVRCGCVCRLYIDELCECCSLSAALPAILGNSLQRRDWPQLPHIVVALAPSHHPHPQLKPHHNRGSALYPPYIHTYIKYHEHPFRLSSISIRP